MNIYLLSLDTDIVSAWKTYFKNCENVETICDDFCNFMMNYDVECVVSPANSFGLMDGGYDAAITEWFGEELQYHVQEYIMKNYFGEQPVGSSFIIETPQKGRKLIHTPTMRIPEKILDNSVIYHCMRSCLITALQNNVESIVIPAFGAATGQVNAKDVAKMMWMAYTQIYKKDQTISWENALESHFRELNDYE